MRRVILVAALLLFADKLQAHDFWIEPSTFHPAPGQTVAVGLRVGQNYIGDAVPRFSRLIENFFIRQGGSDQMIEGSDGIDPAGFLRADGQATALIAYSSLGSPIELPADKFEEYLRLYGLDEIIRERSRRGERAKPGREIFFRYAKALLSGREPSAAISKPLDFVYEIVPDDDPTARPGPLRGHILYKGKPLGDALVVALWRDDPAVQLMTHSDAQGAFSFVLPRAGVWLIKSVHMVRAGFFSSADWESLWASLTFEAPGARP
jgi:uncharacterized GH25 family protein